MPFGLFAAWVRAEAATDFCAAVLFGLLSCFEAFDATDGLVFSFFAMEAFTAVCGQFRASKDGRMTPMKQGQAAKCVEAMRALYGPPHTAESQAEYDRLRVEEMARARRRREGGMDLFASAEVPTE